MPAFLDAVGGAGWLRGLLPLLNRVGQSVPPFLGARRIKLTRQKGSALALASLGQAGCFGLLALVTAYDALTPSVVIASFLILYTLFFAFTGLLNVALGTLTGKLISASRRGRLLSLSTVGGVIPAAGLAAWLLPEWLEPAGSESWTAIFGVTAALFALAAACTLVFREPPDAYTDPAESVATQLRGTARLLRADANLRTLIAVGVLFNTAIMAFPHYQAFAREVLGLAGTNLIIWVIAQNLAMGVASLIVGPLADRYGNRRVLTLLCFGTVGVPGLAVLLVLLERETARLLFPLIFVGNGLIPNGLRILVNYTLEISSEAEHTRYLSLLQLCTAAAFLGSPLLGAAIDRSGFEGVFLAAAAMGLSAGLTSLRLTEPREAAHPSVAP